MLLTMADEHSALAEAGAIASYGTVTEPCAWQQKFPQASVLVKITSSAIRG